MALITALRSDIDHNGYNLTTGGDGVCSCTSQKYRPIYCYELNALFKSANIASAITGDNPSSIRNSSSNFEKGIVQNRTKVKYTYCFIEQMFKLYDKSRMNVNSKPVVSTKDGQLYGSYSIAEKLLDKKTSHRLVLDYRGYLKKKGNYSIYKREYFVVATDYIMVEDLTKIGQFEQN